MRLPFSFFPLSLISVLFIMACAPQAEVDETNRQSFPILVGKDDRRTIQQYADQNGLKESEVQTMFAATGQIDCPWTVASANLIVKNNLIAANAHVLYDRKGVAKGDPRRCRVVFETSEGRQIANLTSTHIAGHTELEERTTSAQDWVVVQLAGPVAHVKPYPISYDRSPIAPKARSQHDRQWHVQVVAAGHGDWPTPNGASPNQIKSISDCTIRGVTWPRHELNRDGVRTLRSDCDAGPGASGGAYLHEFRGEPNLFGLTTGVSKKARLGRHEYELGKHDARGVLVSGKFLQAIKLLASKS